MRDTVRCSSTLYRGCRRGRSGYRRRSGRWRTCQCSTLSGHSLLSLVDRHCLPLSAEGNTDGDVPVSEQRTLAHQQARRRSQTVSGCMVTQLASVGVHAFRQDIVNVTYLAAVAALSFCTLGSCLKFAVGGVAAGILALLLDRYADYINPSPFRGFGCASVHLDCMHKPLRCHSRTLLQAPGRHFHTLARQRCDL